MSATDQARMMLEMAEKDLKSLRHMLDPEEHDDEIVGLSS
jgi:hypothetical protein